MPKPPPQVATSAMAADSRSAAISKPASEPSLIFSVVSFVVAVLLLLTASAGALFGLWLFLTPLPPNIVANMPVANGNSQGTKVALGRAPLDRMDDVPWTEARPLEVASTGDRPAETRAENTSADTINAAPAAKPKFAAQVSLQFDRNGQQLITFDNLQDAEWRLASMVNAIAEAQQFVGDGRVFTVRGFSAEVTTAAETRSFTDPSAAYVYVLHTRTNAGQPAPVAGVEDYSDVVVAMQPATTEVAVAAIDRGIAPVAPVTPVVPEPEIAPAAGSGTFACTIQSIAIKTPIAIKSFEAAERRLLAFERAFERQYDDTRSARLAEGFVAEIDVSGVVHSFHEPVQARHFVRNLKAAKARGEDLAAVDPNAVAEDAGGGAALPPVEISAAAQTYMQARFNQEANIFLARTRRFPTDFEMLVLRQQIFQEAQLRGLIPRDAVYPF